MNAQVEKPLKNTSPSLSKPQGEIASFRVEDHRPAAIAQRKLQGMADNSPRVRQLMAFQQMVNKSLQARFSDLPFQAMMGSVVQRVVTNSHAGNMRRSLARVFGGSATDYTIDRTSGTIFSDGAPNYTTGHHGVGVTDNRTGQVYVVDFHSNGRYYTRG